MVNWPAILKHADDNELTYIHSQDDWDNDTELHVFDYHEADFLVDVNGQVFSLTSRENEKVIPIARENTLALENILGLVKAHAAQKGSCCVAKLYAPTIDEAFKIVASLDEN